MWHHVPAVRTACTARAGVAASRPALVRRRNFRAAAVAVAAFGAAQHCAQEVAGVGAGFRLTVADTLDAPLRHGHCFAVRKGLRTPDVLLRASVPATCGRHERNHAHCPVQNTRAAHV